jgi:hypothetical protein
LFGFLPEILFDVLSGSLSGGLTTALPDDRSRVLPGGNFLLPGSPDAGLLFLMPFGLVWTACCFGLGLGLGLMGMTSLVPVSPTMLGLYLFRSISNLSNGKRAPR